MIFFAETTPHTDAGMVIDKFHSLADEIGPVVIHRIARQDTGHSDCLVIGTNETGNKLEKLVMRLAFYSSLYNGRFHIATNDLTDFVDATSRSKRPVSHQSLSAAHHRVCRDLAC